MIVALFDKYGGAPSVTRIVRDFHERLMRLLFLRYYFEDMEVDKVTNITFNMFSIPFANQEFKMKKMHGQHMQSGVTKASYNQTLEIFFSVLRQRHAGHRL